MRARLRIAEDAYEALLHLRRHRVLDALGLLVRLPPLVTKEVDQHAFRESVPADDRARGLQPALGKTDLSPLVQLQQSVPRHAMDHLRHRRRRYAQELREARADDLAALVGQRVDGLEVLLGRWGGLRRHS